jgi:hypothetical protein
VSGLFISKDRKTTGELGTRMGTWYVREDYGV